jgi:hypothetical protein
MRLFLAGRLPVTSKGAALNHPSQPRGRALMRDVPSVVDDVSKLGFEYGGLIIG